MVEIVLLIIVLSTDHMDVQDNSMGYSSVSVVLVGYDSSCPSMSEPREVLTCGSHLYAPGRHERGIIRQYPHKSVQFFTTIFSRCHSHDWPKYSRKVTDQLSGTFGKVFMFHSHTEQLAG